MKTLLIPCLVICSALFSWSPLARAEARFSQDFIREVESFRKICSTQPCPYTENLIYVHGHRSRIGQGLLRSLQAAALDRAQIWADTILEGDYVADGVTRLDRVYMISNGNKTVAYRIVYSEQAWFTADCSYDSSDESSLQECQAGRIVEASFVSPELNDVIADEDGFAEFKSLDR